MNLFQFLKAKSGKIALGATQLASTAAIGGVLAVSAWNFANPPQPAQNMPVRSFSHLASGYGATASNMNVSAGGLEFASAEEQARLDGSATTFGLDNEKYVDNLGQAVQAGPAGSVGSGYQMSGSEGLGLGANDTTILEGASGGSAAGGASGAAASVASVNQAAAQAAGTSAGGPKLANASIARATGGSGAAGASSGMAVSGNRSADARGGTGSSSAAGAGEGRYLSVGAGLSGAMPQGSSSLVAKPKFNASRDGVGQSKNARAAGGSQSKDGKDLAFIAKRSADVAGNKNRSANEGSAPFLASSQNSGGMTVDKGGEEVTSAGSADFEAPRLGKEKKLGALDTGGDTWLKEQQRKEHRSRLLSTIIALSIASVAGMFACAALAKVKPWGLAAAIGIAALISVAWGVHIADAISFGQKYDDHSWTIATCLTGGVLMAGLWTSIFVPAVQKFITKIGDKINKFFGGAELLGGASGAMGGFDAAKGAVQNVQAMNQEAQAEKDAVELDKKKK